MSHYSVLVCDDNPKLAGACVEEIKRVAPDDYVVRTESNEAVHESTSELLRRRRAVRDKTERARVDCMFDAADIFVVDYDLVHIDDDNTEYTGESLARLARTFSDCAVVVVLNQFGETDFDLSLRGHLASHADLNIDVKLIGTPGLWRSPPWDGFRPWAWQTLSDAVKSQRARERIVGSNLDNPIVEVFGMEAEDSERLSDSAFAFVAPGAERVEGLHEGSFISFLEGTANGRDARCLLDEGDRTSAVRFISSRIGKWLEREVLGPQDVLMDVPHLLQRFPFVLGKDIGDKAAWNGTVHEPERLKEVIDERYWFDHPECISKAAVWCRRLETDEEINAERAAFDFAAVPDFVFMEDCSVFADISEATEFRAGFHNAFDRRFVRRVDGIRYRPQRRFAFGGGR